MQYTDNELFFQDLEREIEKASEAAPMPQSDLVDASEESIGRCPLYSYDAISVVAGSPEEGKKRPSRKSEKYEFLLSQLQKNSNLRNYQFNESVDDRLQALAEAMPNYRSVIEVIESAISFARCCNRPLTLTPILLNGEPGIGKSYFTNRLAEALCVSSSVHDMASASSAGSLSGTDSQWSNAEPGDVLHTLATSDHLSPIFVLDELDKAPSTGNTSPRTALYSLLEPETSRHFRDRCLSVTVNASHIIWIATANNARQVIEPPLLSRFHCFDIDLPSETQRYNLAESLIQAATKEMQKHIGSQIIVEPSVVESLAHMNPRGQKQCLTVMLGRLAKEQSHCLSLKHWPKFLSADKNQFNPNAGGIGFFAEL